MRISYKFRMYDSDKNHRLDKMVMWGIRIRNHCVAFQKTYYRMFGKYCSANTLKGHIAKLRNRNDNWKIVGSQCVQGIIERLDLTYKQFFKWIKTKSGVRKGSPKFKKSTGCGSVTFKQNGYALLGGNKLRIGKHVYKFVKTREIQGKIKTCTIKRDSLGRFWVIFSCIKDFVSPIAGSTNTAGFDFGLKTFLTSSDSKIESPEFFKRGLSKIASLNREFSRKVKGSKNREKSRWRLKREYEKIVNRRRDWFFKLAHSLCDKYDRMYFETLNLEGMKKLWGRKVSDLAFGEFLDILKWVSFKRGKVVGQVGKWEPTTKRCIACGSLNDIPLSKRIYECGCGLTLDRDLNAALNIQLLGHQQDGLEDVRRVTAILV